MSIPTGRELLLYNITSSMDFDRPQFVFVSHRGRPPDDRVVESGDPKEGRSIFVIDSAGDRLYRIRCPAYENRYLFCSFDEEGDKLVEAKPDANDDRTLFRIELVNSGRYAILNPRLAHFVGISRVNDGPDQYVMHSTEISLFVFLDPLAPPPRSAEPR